MMVPTPHEIAIGGIYLPPMLIAAFFGIFATIITTRALNYYRLSKYFFYPPLVTISLVIIYTILIGIFFIGI